MPFRAAALLLLLPALASMTGSVLAQAPAAPPVPGLSALVREYVQTHDTDRADHLLTEILGRADATIPALSSILAAGRTYRKQPTGAQPSRLLRVGAEQYKYALYVPDSYDSDKAYALVVCLHGAGFTGDSYLERWQTRLGDGYILVCPTLSMDASWWTRTAEDLVLAAIRTVIERYHIDPDRVFLTGMSNGGIGAYLIGAHQAPRFAAVVPMAGGLPTPLMPFLENFRQTPLYIIHGKQDQVMPVDLSRSIDEALTDLHYAHVYREHDRVHPQAGGHYFPREELPDLMAWLGRQRREPYPRKITVVRDASHLSTFGWVRIDATDRIAEFSENLVDQHDELITSRRYARLEAEITGPNRIEVRTQRVRRFTLYLNDKLVDLSQPVTVMTNGAVSHQDIVAASPRTLLHEARLRQDDSLLFPAMLSVNVEGKD